MSLVATASEVLMPSQPSGASLPAWLTRIVELVRDYWALLTVIGTLLIGSTEGDNDLSADS